MTDNQRKLLSDVRSDIDSLLTETVQHDWDSVKWRSTGVNFETLLGWQKAIIVVLGEDKSESSSKEVK